MAERDYGRELDELKEQIAKLTEMLGGKFDQPDVWVTDDRPDEWVGSVRKMRSMHPDPNIMAIMDRLEDDCGRSGDTGRIAYLGVFTSGGNQSSWIQNDVSANELLELISSRKAEQTISSVGSGAGLSILLALLRKPRTVAELVEECGFSSTGSAYHHLGALVDAGIVEPSEVRAEYKIQPSRVQGVIMLLAGVKDLMGE